MYLSRKLLFKTKIMKTITVLSISILALFSMKMNAQFNTNYEFLSMNPSIGVGIGSSAYYGDLSIEDEFSAAKSSTTGFNLFYHHYGLYLFVLYDQQNHKTI